MSIKRLNFASRVINVTQIQEKADLVTTIIYYYQLHRNHTCHAFFFKKHNKYNTVMTTNPVFTASSFAILDVLLTSTTVGKAEVLA